MFQLPNHTWFLIILAVAGIVVGSIATIVIRIGKVPNWRKVGIVLCWIVGLLIFKFVIWYYICEYRENTKYKMAATVQNSVGVVVHQQKKWLFWQIVNGQKSPVLEVQVTKDENGRFNFVINRTGGGRIETSAGFELYVNGNEMTGHWVNYEDMKDNGAVILIQTSNGNTWTGSYMSPASGGQISCTLEKVDC